jgi:hypothetical protein
LSVETLTKRSTSNSAQSSATLRVPTTLLKKASSGFDSMRGTCLCAAAWNTTFGRQRSNTWRRRSRLLTSATTIASGAATPRSASSFWTSKRLFSPHPTSTSWRGIDPRQLAHQLGADGSAGAGDHDAGAIDVRPHRLQLQRYGFPLQQVVEPHGPEPRDRHLAVQQLEHAGITRTVTSACDAATRSWTRRTTPRGPGDGDHHLVHAPRVEDRREVVDRADDLHALDDQALLAGVVVEEADRP